MKLFTLLLPILTLCGSQLCAQPPKPADPLSRASMPVATNVAADLFWVADSRKMDQFLAQVQLPDADGTASFGGVLPDTRSAWRDYALEARAFARQGRVADAAGRLAQMLKLAAVYRAAGGLENVVQGEEIRYLAGLMAAELGSAVTTRIQSPYLEKNAAQCLALLESKLGGSTARLNPSFWQNLAQRALETHARLARAGSVALAATP